MHHAGMVPWLVTALTLPSHSLDMALEVCSVIFGHFGEPAAGPLVHGFDGSTFTMSLIK